MGTSRIFVTSDDSIHSPGLWAAAAAAAELGEVVVVAPETQHTGAGRSHSANPDARLNAAELDLSGIKVRAYACDCSPAAAVRHGIDALFGEDKPDLIVAGINYGENLGINIGTSGTVGAAMEGASHGIPALAISKQTDVNSHHRHTNQDWEASAFFLKLFARLLLSKGMPPDVDVLKIDVPDDASEATPWRLTRIARRPYYSWVLPNASEESRLGDRKTTINRSAFIGMAGTDIHALAVERIVSVTPLSLDLTSRVALEELDRLLRKN
jgi:5'-nucleotidase